MVFKNLLCLALEGLKELCVKSKRILCFVLCICKSVHMHMCYIRIGHAVFGTNMSGAGVSWLQLVVLTSGFSLAESATNIQIWHPCGVSTRNNFPERGLSTILSRWKPHRDVISVLLSLSWIIQLFHKDNSLSLRSEEILTINPGPLTNQNQESSPEV